MNFGSREKTDEYQHQGKNGRWYKTELQAEFAPVMFDFHDAVLEIMRVHKDALEKLAKHDTEDKL